MTWTTRPRSEIGSLAAICAGEGPCVLLIHGVGLCADAWAHQIDALASACRVIAVDLPGHGNSPQLVGQPDIAAYTDMMSALVTEPTVVVGHSMGAMIALDLASRSAPLITGVAALNGIFERNADAARAVQGRAASLDGLSVTDPAPTLDRWFGASTSLARDACHRWLSSVDPLGYKRAYYAFAQSDGASREVLATLRVPALFMTGSEEPNSTPAMSEAMAKLAPLGRARIVDGAAHMMPMTHSDEVNVALLDFIRAAWR